MGCTLREKAPCVLYPLQACSMPQSDIDITGTPCKDYSRRGRQMGRQGPWAKVLLTWLKVHRTLETPVLMHENVSDFDGEVLDSCMSDMYDIITFDVVSPKDVGMTGLARPRRVHTLLHKLKVRVLHDPRSMLATLQDAAQQVQVQLTDLWC